MLGDLVRLELLVEVAGATELGDALVDGDAAHLRRAVGDDALPADAAVHDPRNLLELARQQTGERRKPRHAEPCEADRVEQHPQPGPVDDVADHACEQRDRDQLECLAVHGDLAATPSSWARRRKSPYLTSAGRPIWRARA